MSRFVLWWTSVTASLVVVSLQVDERVRRALSAGLLSFAATRDNAAES